MIKVNRTEQHRITKKSEIYPIIDILCFKSKNLYNAANYIIRQDLFLSGGWIRYNELFGVIKGTVEYKDLGSNVGQQTLRLVDKNWKSFYTAAKDFTNNPTKYKSRPKIPAYKKRNGRFFLGIDNNKFSLSGGFIKFGWKPLRCLNDKFVSKIPTDSKLIQCRFIPRGLDYVMEVIYEIEVNDNKRIPTNIASIDLGIDNFATMTNNIGLHPIAIKGGVIKSINQYYNKQNALIRSELKLKNNVYTSRRIKQLCGKREFKIKDWMHKASKYIITYCLENNIDTLVCGYNEGWKQNVNMGKCGNQRFVAIPYLTFIAQLNYKCKDVGIGFITTEESYTSGTSFMDNEFPNEENYKISRRTCRGLFETNDGKIINADVNGSYQIMKKVFPDAFVNGIEGAGSHPRAIWIT